MSTIIKCHDCGFSTADLRLGMGHAAMRDHTLSAPADAEGTTVTISVAREEYDDDEY